MRPSGSRPSSSPSEGPGPPGGLDVYLFPAVIGGGFGDIAEVLDAGRQLQAAGLPIRLYRPADRPLPPGVDGPWDWPLLERVDRLRPAAPCALTVTPAWGVSAAPDRPGPLGRAGPWAREAAEVERVYGPERTVHVSLEEFARTLTSREENFERYREGGVPVRSARRRAASPEGEAERVRWVAAFRRFRALDLPNVLHLLATFERSAPFAREFPEIVQVGPLWPGAYRPRPRSRRAPSSASVLWYASPASSATIAPGLFHGLAGFPGRLHLGIRSARLLALPRGPNLVSELLSPLPTRLWRPRFSDAALRVVTGSRTLLEALELGGPFLYFNGVTGPPGRHRRHRPEKIVQLVRLFRRLSVARRIVRDLDDFSRARRVPPIVGRALADADWRAGFPTPAEVRSAVPEPLGDVLLRVARRLASEGGGASGLVREVRLGAVRSGESPRSKV